MPSSRRALEAALLLGGSPLSPVHMRGGGPGPVGVRACGRSVRAPCHLHEKSFLQTQKARGHFSRSPLPHCDARPDGPAPVADKPEEIVPASKPSRATESVALESRVATIKQRPTSRCFPSVSDVNVSAHPPPRHPHPEP